MDKKAKINLKKRFAFQKPFHPRPGYTQTDALEDTKDLWKPAFDIYASKKNPVIS